MSVACGNKKVHDLELSKVHHHITAAAVKVCFMKGGIPSEEEEAQYEEDEALHRGVAEAEMGYERWLENGGAHAAAIHAEDLYEQQMEANDPWLQALRAGRAEVMAEEEAEAPSTVEASYAPLKDGIFTVTHSKGHRTFRVRTQESEAKFKPGVQLLGYLAGPDNTSDYVQFGEIKADGSPHIWAKHRGKTEVIADLEYFMADPEGPDVQAAVHCYRCHRLLTVPESIATGWGPECRGLGLR